MTKIKNPLIIFINEHTELLVNLKKLNHLNQAIKNYGFTVKSLKAVDDILKKLEHEISHHNKLEERALFPVLEKYVEGPTTLLKEEHKLMKNKFKRLHNVIRKAKMEKVTSVHFDELTLSIGEVIQVFVNHIHKENYILFPLLNRFFTTNELNKIAKKMF